MVQTDMETDPQFLRYFQNNISLALTPGPLPLDQVFNVFIEHFDNYYKNVDNYDQDFDIFWNLILCQELSQQFWDSVVMKFSGGISIWDKTSMMMSLEKIFYGNAKLFYYIKQIMILP